MTTITPTAFDGSTVRLVRPNKGDRKWAETVRRPVQPTRFVGIDVDLEADIDPMSATAVAAAEVPAVEANTAELMLASIDLVGRRSDGTRSAWLATSVVLAGVLAAVALALLGAAVLSPILFGF